MSDQPSTVPDPMYLRDRLLATLTEFQVQDGPLAVEAVCDQFCSWLRVMADGWIAPNEYAVDMGIRRASAELLRGLAEGIEAGAPDVSPQDSGVQ